MDKIHLVVGGEYQIPGCPNVFKLTSYFKPNQRCFSRQDGERHYGREFIEYKDGNAYLVLEPRP